MNILIYGAGVLGSLYAAQLQLADHRVSILARGQRLTDIRKHGIVLENALTAQRTIVQVNVVEQLAPNDAYDLIIVLMRKTQIPVILPILGANQHTPTILFLGNNAAGFDQYIDAVGRERALFGFARAGGIRKDHIVYYIANEDDSTPMTIGEIDGEMSPRVQQLASSFRSAKIPVAISRNIDAWLKTHVALVSPLANALYSAGGDNYRLAHTRDGLIMGVRAMREGFAVLRALGIPVTPIRAQLLGLMPEPLLVNTMRKTLDSKVAEYAMAGHANAARDEMRQLADEFKALAMSTDIATPYMDRLYTYLDPTVPPIPEDSHKLEMDWRSVTVVMEVFALYAAMRRLLRRRRVITLAAK
ncbi:MAG: ketopantoate reductase family protein [Anaerolineae bacterium]|nr:ketopantoate reductase family protein [Anaerolineae bacterium]